MLRSSFTALRYRPKVVPRRVASRRRGGLLSGEERQEARPEAPASSVDGWVASRVVMEADQIARACARMAHQILEANRGAHGLVLMGIPTRGVPLAHRLAQVMDEVEGVRVPVGALDVTMYRDDLRRQPTRAVGRTDLPVDVEGSTVVLVDDVLYSGRTVQPRWTPSAILVGRAQFGLPCGDSWPPGAAVLLLIMSVATSRREQVSTSA